MTTAEHFVDLQINGYAGVDFNADHLDPEHLHHACERLRDDGVDHVLATIITDAPAAMERRLRNLVAARRASSLSSEVICGLHVEGPFLNETPGYVGAHPAQAVCPADPDLMHRLLAAGDGWIRMVTLAPERDPQFRVTRLLSAEGVAVAAGHCDPALDQLRGAIDAGLSLFTHLGNGCPLLLPRHDNIVQRVLSLSDRLRIGLIADGIHVPLTALGNYLRLIGDDRAFIGSDAVQAAGMGPGNFRLGDQEVVVDEHLATWSADRSHLVGSACTLRMAARNLREGLGLSDAQIARLTQVNPRNILGIGAAAG